MSPIRHDSRRSRLPALGRRGEGWVIGQALLIAAVLLSPLADRSWTGHATVTHVAGAALLALGMLLLAAAACRLGGSLTPLPAPRAGGTLTKTGPYALVRHPMYGAAILIAFGWAVLFATVVGLAIAVAVVLFLELKSRREELWLSEQFEDYEAYRRATPHRFLPFLH